MTRLTVSAEDASPQHFEVADLRVDVGTVRVTRAGTVIALPRLSFDLLVALIRVAPRVATIDELMNIVWPDLVVGPETVSQRVKLLRDALGDDSKQPRYIAAVRGRGYQLIPRVHPAELSAEPEPGSGPAPGRRPRHKVAWLTGAIFAAVAVAGVLVWMASSGPERESPRDAAQAVGGHSIAVLPFEALSDAPADRILASGIAEAVLHKLANARGLAVIARTSSFALQGRKLDIRTVGRELNVRYVLEGSVQRDAGRLRVTCQLIDAASGRHLWSLQFDKPPQDVFAVQDEIALRVASALDLALDDDARRRMTRQGTSNIQAYIAYLEGSSLLATWRLAETQQAAERFAQSLRIDPAFPAAYISLARARVHEAEYGTSVDRDERFRSAVEGALGLVEKAMTLDPQLASAYIERAHLLAFTDLEAAERDYRHGIALSPSNARAYQELAAVVWEDEARRPEALALIDRARALDPIDLEHDVTKAVYLYFGPARIAEAEQLLLGVLERDPDYVPALARLGSMYTFATEHIAKGIQLLEHAIEVDPQAEEARRALVRAYLGVNEPAAAAIVSEAGGEVDARSLPLYYFRRDWPRAARAARGAIASNTLDTANQEVAVYALRMDARRTGDVESARALVELVASVSWDADGAPRLGKLHGTWNDAAGLADLMTLGGERQRAEQLLRAVLVRTEPEGKVPGPGSFWNHQPRALAYALLGRDRDALLELEACYPRTVEQWYWVDIEPAFERLRAQPAFQALRARIIARRDSERAALHRLRAAGLVVDRSPARR